MRENYWTRRRFSRRTVLKATAAGAVGAGALVAVGCGDDDDDDDVTTPAATQAAATQAAATEAAATEAAATEAATAEATREAVQEATPEPTQAAGALGPVDGSFFSQIGTTTGTTLDLHRELYRSIAYTAGNSYNNLIKFTNPETFTIGGEIARGLPEQPDELTYTFTIRDDVRWHNKPPANGRALTMDDVRWNIERQRAGTLQNGEEAPNFYRSGQIYSPIENVDYIDDTTFTVTMSRKAVTWLSDMAAEEFNVIMHPEVATSLEDEDNFGTFSPDFIVGTGAWIAEEFDPLTRARFVRNDDYFLRLDGTIPGMVDEWYHTDLGTDVNPQRLAFEQKQVDEFSTRQNDVIEAVHEATGANLIQYGNPNNNLEFAYNQTVNDALAVPAIRQAMFLAWDRVLSAQIVFQGLARPNPGINWPFTSWALPQEELLQMPGYRQPKDDDIKEARALWEQGGAEDFEDELFTPVIVDLADQSIKEWWPAMMNENLGTDKWSIEAIPVATLLEYNVSGQNPVGYLGGWDQWVSPDPRTRFASVYSSSARGFLNFYGYHTDTMENFITQAFDTFDVEEAQNILLEAQRFMPGDAGSGHVQVCGGLVQVLQWPYVHRAGPFFIQMGTNLSQELWIDQTDPSFEGKSRPT